MSSNPVDLSQPLAPGTPAAPHSASGEAVARLEDRLTALRRLAQDGYPVGVTIAPIIAVPDWRTHYGDLLDNIADAVRDVPDLDLTAELITHQGKFGAVKYVYLPATMTGLRSWFYGQIAERLPPCRVLYWT